MGAHPEALNTLEMVARFFFFARAAARRLGLRSHDQLLRRTRCAIGVQIVIRSVRMARGCLSSPADLEALFPQPPDVSIGSRLWRGMS